MKLLKICALTLCTAGMVTGCSDSDVLATVNGHDVTNAEFDAYLKFKRIPEQDEARVERALDEYLKRAAMTNAIKASGELDAALVQAELEEFRRQMYISRYFQNYLREAVDDEAVRNYYSNHAEQYETRRAHAAHILFRVNSKMSEAERQAKLTSAHEAYSRLQKGESFEEVAKTYSEDKVSAEKGGDLGWLQQGAVDPRFSETLFAMEPGDISEPFLTPFGFHVVTLIEGPQAVKKPLEAVEGDIRYQLRNEAKLEETKRLLNTVAIEREGSL